MTYSQPAAARVSIAWGNADDCLRIGSFAEQVTPLFRVPMQIIIGGHDVLCQSALWPLRSSSLNRLHLEHALEYAIDDTRMVQEAFRVLAPGGEMTIEVPNARGFGVFDGFNAFRYVSDVTGRGPELPEIAETGWRRHYTRTELDALLRSAGFTIDDWHSRGIAGSELRIIRNLVRRQFGAQPSNDVGRKASTPVPGSWGARLQFRAHKPG